MTPSDADTPLTAEAAFEALAALCNRDIEGQFEERTGTTFDAVLATLDATRAAPGLWKALAVVNDMLDEVEDSIGQPVHADVRRKWHDKLRAALSQPDTTAVDHLSPDFDPGMALYRAGFYGWSGLQFEHDEDGWFIHGDATTSIDVAYNKGSK